ncbi:MAG: nucleotidyltransferase family protein [Variovorax sp.]
MTCALQLGIIHAMDRADTLALLKRHKPELQRRFGVLRLALFGSRVREESREDSDADVLVSFKGPASSACYFGVQFYLEDLLGCPVDLVTDKALRPELRPFIERDAIHV